MALQTDGYNADTEGSNNSPLADDSDDMEDERDPESARIVLERLELNGGPPFRARDYMSGDDFSDYSIESDEDEDSDYDERPKKKKKRPGRRVKCDECNRRFCSKNIMLKHKAVHSGQFTCSKCNKKCVSAGSLRLHQRIHTGERPHKCDECSEAFAFKLQLLAHVDKAHNDGVLPYACDECDKAFRKASQLGMHKRAHLERTHECDFCGKGFISKAAVNGHVQRVHRAMPSDTPGDGGRRSGRTTRVDYRDEVINVETMAVEPKRKKRPANAFSAKVKSRLRSEEEPPPKPRKAKGKAAKSRRKPLYTGAGTQPSRGSSRATKAVNYADRDIKSEDEDDDEGSGDERAVKRKGRGRPKREPVENGHSDGEESEEEAKPTAKRGPKRGRGRPKKAAASEDEEEEQEEESPKTQRGRVLGRGRQKKAAAAEPEDEESEQEEKRTNTSRGRGRTLKKQPPKRKAEESEEESEPEPEETPRGRGRASTGRKLVAEPEESTKKTPGRGGRKKPAAAAAEENGEEESDAEEPPPTKKTPRGRPAKAETPASPDPESDSESAEAAENGTSDAAYEETPKGRRGRAAATPKSAASVRGGGRRSTATNVSFAENSDSEEDDADSRVPPKKRLRGRQ